MNIPLRARLIDIANLVVSKGANFAATVAVFGLVAHHVTPATFAQFGYWWSVALLFGGGLLGGLSSATIRAVARFGSLRQERRLLPWAVGGAAVIALAAMGVVFGLTGRPEAAFLTAGVCAFGVVVQLQSATSGLLRAVEASAANVFASIAMFVVIPSTVMAALLVRGDLPILFLALSLGFVLATAATVVIGRHTLAPLVTRDGTPAPPSEFFWATMAFSLANVFSYGLTNLDFTLLKILVSADAFTLVGQSKVFFDRFALPIMLIAAGAVSLNVLRHSGERQGAEPRLQINRSGYALAVAGGVWLALIVGYYAFALVVSRGSAPLPFVQVACIAFGYVVYAANSVLIDLLIIKRRVAVVGAYLLSLFVTAIAVEGALIWAAGVAGWVIGWPIMNLMAFALLARIGLHVRTPQAGAK
jgi:hypothetical protein